MVYAPRSKGYVDETSGMSASLISTSSMSMVSIHKCLADNARWVSLFYRYLAVAGCKEEIFIRLY